MNLEDPSLQAFGYRFGRDFSDREAPKLKLIALLSDIGFQSSLKQEFASSVSIVDDGVDITTPIGVLKLEFVPVLEQVAREQVVCGWAAVFSEIDERGEHRDLYAARLSINRVWTDGTGLDLPHDEDWSEPSISTAVQIVRRALAAKLRLSEARVAKLLA